MVERNKAKGVTYVSRAPTRAQLTRSEGSVTSYKLQFRHSVIGRAGEDRLFSYYFAQS